MGEEQKKPEEAKVEEKKPEEAKKPEKAPGNGKKDEGKTEESNESKDPPPPPPQEIVLRVFMHCEGCARKVRKCLKGFEGVEDVQTDCKTHKVVVKGEKADPLKVLGRVQRKNHRQVELLSPIPKPAPAEEPKKEEPPKPEEKKEEPPQVIMVVLKVHMHCEACAQEIKKRIQRMKGVEGAEPDLKSSQVTVKGVFDPPQLVEYVYKRTGKHAVIVKQEPEKKEEEGKGKDGKAEKKAEEGEKKAEEGGGGKDKKEGGGEEVAKAEPNPEETTVVELKKNEYYYYPQNHHYPQNHPLSYPPNYPPQNVQFDPQRFATESYAYPPAPEMFSDENPNACSVM